MCKNKFSLRILKVGILIYFLSKVLSSNLFRINHHYFFQDKLSSFCQNYCHRIFLGLIIPGVNNATAVRIVHPIITTPNIIWPKPDRHILEDLQENSANLKDETIYTGCHEKYMTIKIQTICFVSMELKNSGKEPQDLEQTNNISQKLFLNYR